MNLYMRAVAEALDGPPDYAWIVTMAYGVHPDDDDRMIEDPGHSTIGRTGPACAPPKLLELLEAGRGRVWRTVMDGVSSRSPKLPAHKGRYLDWSDLTDAELAEVFGTDPAKWPPRDRGGNEFGPHDDFSEAVMGSTGIQYRQENGSWKDL